MSTREVVRRIRSVGVDNSDVVAGHSAPMDAEEVARGVDGVLTVPGPSTDAPPTVPVRRVATFDLKRAVRGGAAGQEAGVQR